MGWSGFQTNDEKRKQLPSSSKTQEASQRKKKFQNLGKEKLEIKH